uniref:GST N-terminal domain-containing protein n=1 Tax=Branchiostoma floridae TaxID=7739 RepID=C3YC06_BRAFL|eukprot:XP_002606171.1 hypothetical protein BRAFLDRAFT_126492 [Branchiostoma floridae]
MASEVSLYWASGSVPSMSVLIALEEKGIAYNTKEVSFADLKSEEILKLNPRGQVPILSHGELLITESLAICLYVEGAADNQKLAKEIDNWEAYLTQGSYITGGDFTMADVVFFPVLAYLVWEGTNLDGKYPKLATYYNMVRERPSVKTSWPAYWESPSGKGPDRHDVRIVNLALVSHVDVVHECTEPPPALPVLNFQKLEARARHECSEKWKAVNLIGIGVSPEGQKLFNAIHKTISETRWKDKDIVVLDDVVISPPYGLENCKGKEGQALAQVRKILVQTTQGLDYVTALLSASACWNRVLFLITTPGPGPGVSLDNGV